MEPLAVDTLAPPSSPSSHGALASLASLAPEVADRFRAEAVRLHRRYVLEVVEACGLCPWAEAARVRRRTAEAVFLEEDGAACTSSLAVIDAWAKETRIEVGFLLYPRLSHEARAFEAFTGEVRERHSAQHPLGSAPFVFAAFHPDARPETGDAERLIPFLRRSPDRCIQIVRAKVLDRVRSGTPQGTAFVDVSDLAAFEASALSTARPLREVIARANLETVERMGLAELQARLDDIRRDRDRTYAALLEREPA